MAEMTLTELVDDLVAVRHASGYRFKVPERVLRQFAQHCARQGYPHCSITKEAVEEFLDGRHLRACRIRRNAVFLRQLAEHARALGWAAYVPKAITRVLAGHHRPNVFTDDETRKLFTAIDTGLRISEALQLHLADVDTDAATMRLRDSKNGHSRTIPITARLATTEHAYSLAAHPDPVPGHHLFYARATDRYLPLMSPTATLVTDYLDHL